MTERGPIFLISGPPGSGKTTVAQALLVRFSHGLHIPVDDLREWVVSGIAHPIPVWTGETTRQFSLARAAACATARLYADEGFAVAIDDVITADDAARDFTALADLSPRQVVLLPDVTIAQQRNAERSNKVFDTGALHEPIRTIHRLFADQSAPGWLVLDTSALGIEETVDMIVAEK